MLTPREQDVLALIRDGLTNEQIAVRLNISFETAKSHVAGILIAGAIRPPQPDDPRH